MADVPDTFDGLEVAVRKTPEGSHYAVGVVIEGGFFVFGAFSAGGFEEDYHEAVAAQAEASSAKK